MRVIDFVDYVLSLSNYKSKVITKQKNVFDFVVNESANSASDLDTCICFDGGISVKELINYVTLHNLEAYTMYQSAHYNLNYGDVIIRDEEVIVP